LYNRYLEFAKQGNGKLEEVLQQIYHVGRQLNWQVDNNNNTNPFSRTI
jgi:hypothetical protein